jgi:hypothetical protein
MKTIKPMRTGVLCRPFEHQGRCLFAVGAIAYFAFDGAAPASLLPEVALWGDLAQELGGDFVFDEAMPKLTAEVLVTGNAYAPGGVAQAAVNARVAIGDVDKTVLVVGDRRWEHGAMTSPTPFVEMPLSWARAFGGEGFARNPLGRGYAPVASPWASGRSTSAGPSAAAASAPTTRRGSRPGRRASPTTSTSRSSTWPRTTSTTAGSSSATRPSGWRTSTRPAR